MWTPPILARPLVADHAVSKCYTHPLYGCRLHHVMSLPLMWKEALPLSLVLAGFQVCVVYIINSTGQVCLVAISAVI